MAVVIDEVEAEVEGPPNSPAPAATGSETKPATGGATYPKLDRYLRLSAEREERVCAY
jgi:hypothetical protein